MLKKLIVILLSTVIVLGAMLSLYEQEIAIMISIGQAKLEQMLNGEQVKPENPVDGDSDIESITIDTSGAKLVFDFASEFSAEGIKVIANMSDGSKKEIPLEDCRISPADTTKPGKRQVVVIYEGKSARYDVTVNLKVIPEISNESLLNITESNKEYRVEAEAFDMATPGAKLQSGFDSFVASGAEETSGGQYLTGYGKAWNYFGFTFTAAEEYKDSTLVLRVANSTAADINAGAVKMYLNFSQDAEGVASGEIPLEGYIIEAKGACEWSEIVIRNLTIPAGTNTLTFEVQGEDKAFDLDYIDFHVAKPYVKSIVEITDTTTIVKDLEALDTEKAFTREDVANHWGLKDGQLFVEKVTKESPGKSTSGGTSVGAVGNGSQISTYIYVAEDSTIRISFKAAKATNENYSYFVVDNWGFYIDGVKLTTVERVDIKGGDSKNGYWWDWIYTPVGDINLTAGYHSFIIEVHGEDCNVDTVEFQAISIGSFAESGKGLEDMHDCANVCPDCGKCTNKDCDKKVCADKCKGHENVDTNFDITVSTDTTYKAEAEKLDKSNLIPSSGWEDRGVQIETPTSSYPVTSGGKSIGACGGGYTTISIKLLEKATIQIYGRIAESKGGDASNLMSMSIGGTELVANGTLPTGVSGNQYWNWADIPFGMPINLEAGEYTLTITFKTGVNFDCVKVDVLSYGEFIEVDCDWICETCGKCTNKLCQEPIHADKCGGHIPVDVNINASSNEYKIEAENLSTSTLVGDSKGVQVESYSGGKGLGHIAAGGYQSFVVSSDSDVTVKLYITFANCNGGSILQYIPTIKVNGESIQLIDSEVPKGIGTAKDTPDTFYWNVTDVLIATVELKADEIYTFQVYANSGNLDAYTIKIGDGNNSDVPGEYSDVDVATSGTTRLEMETLNLSASTIVSDAGAVRGNKILDGQVGGHKDAKTGQQSRLYWFREGTRFVIAVKVDAACTLDISLVGWGSKSLDTYSYSFGGQVINCTETASLGGSESAPDSKSIGTVTVTAPGVYELVLDIYDIDFDAITFTVVE